MACFPSVVWVIDRGCPQAWPCALPKASHAVFHPRRCAKSRSCGAPSSRACGPRRAAVWCWWRSPAGARADSSASCVTPARAGCAAGCFARCCQRSASHGRSPAVRCVPARGRAIQGCHRDGCWGRPRSTGRGPSGKGCADHDLRRGSASRGACPRHRDAASSAAPGLCPCGPCGSHPARPRRCCSPPCCCRRCS